MARNVLVETGGVRIYTPGRGNLKAAKRGERDKSSAKSESSESGRERGVAVNCSNGSKALRCVTRFFKRTHPCPRLTKY